MKQKKIEGAQQNGMRFRWSLNDNEWHALVSLAECQSATY